MDRTLIWSAGEEETTAWLDRRTGELTPDLTWNNPALLWQTGSAAVYTGQTELLVWPLDEDEIYLLPDRAGDTLRDLAGRTVLLADDKGYLEILDLWNQTAWRRWEPQCVMTVLTDESLVYAVYANGATDLYRWDYRLDGSSETACACLTVEELETRNRAAAAALAPGDRSPEFSTARRAQPLTIPIPAVIWGRRSAIPFRFIWRWRRFPALWRGILRGFFRRW